LATAHDSFKALIGNLRLHVRLGRVSHGGGKGRFAQNVGPMRDAPSDGHMRSKAQQAEWAGGATGRPLLIRR
jgi:hypothetical protein